MYCGKCGADKGDSVLCPVCEGGGVNNGFLAAQKMKTTWICSIVFIALELVYGLWNFYRNIQIRWEREYFTTFGETIKYSFTYYLYLIPLALLLFFVIRKGKKSVFVSFYVYCGVLLLKSCSSVATDVQRLTSMLEADWYDKDMRVAYYKLLLFLVILLLLVRVFQLVWIALLAGKKRQSKKFCRSSPFVVAGAYLGYRCIDLIARGIFESTYNWEISEEPIELLISISIYIGFSFFLTKYMAEIDMPVRKRTASAPACGAPVYTPPAYTPPVYTPPPAPSPMAEPMFAPEPQPTYSPQPAPQPVYQPTPVPVPAPSAATELERNETAVIEVLQKYKDLLDRGVITQEEFDRKKDQLLK